MANQLNNIIEGHAVRDDFPFNDVVYCLQNITLVILEIMELN